MTPNEKVFYQALGQRIASLRKEQGITQVQLAETLGIAQQTLAHYEVGRLRIAAGTLPPLAKALTTSVEELLGEESTASKDKRAPPPPRLNCNSNWNRSASFPRPSSALSWRCWIP